LKKPLLPRFTANEKNTLLRVTAIKKIMPAKAESLKKEFGVTCVCTGARLPKKAPRKTNARREADAFKKVVRGYVPGGTGARYLKKYARYKRLLAGRRKSLKRSPGLRTGRTGVRLFKKTVYTSAKNFVS